MYVYVHVYYLGICFLTFVCGNEHEQACYSYNPSNDYQSRNANDHTITTMGGATITIIAYITAWLWYTLHTLDNSC